MSMTRRAFLGVGATAVGVGAFGGVARAASSNDSLLRPPAVADEGAFLSRCIRCYRCVSVCHTGALVPATLNDGLVEIRTPKFDFHQGYCDFCGDCRDVCPTEAISWCDPYDPGTGRIGVAEVDPQRCIAYFNGCTVCAERCPYGAIFLDGNDRPVVDGSRCNGCGVCVHECPALVYRSFSGGAKRGIEIAKLPSDPHGSPAEEGADFRA